MKIDKQYFKKYGMIGTGFGIVAFALSWLYSLIPKSANGVQATLNLAPLTSGLKSQIQAGVSQDLASKLLGYLNGIPFDFMGIIHLIIAGITIALVGGFIVEMIPKKYFFTKTGTMRLISVGVIGTFIAGWIVTFLSKAPIVIPSWQMALVMTGYFAIVAIVYGFFARLTKDTPFKKIFIEA